MLGGFSDQIAELQNIKHKNVQDRGGLETSEFCNIFFIVWHSETIDFKCSRKASASYPGALGCRNDAAWPLRILVPRALRPHATAKGPGIDHSGSAHFLH